MPNMFGGDQLGEDYDPCGYEKNPRTVQVIIIHVPSGREFVGEVQEMSEEQIEQLGEFLRQGASGGLDYFKFVNKLGNDVIIGKKLLLDCEFNIVFG